jgi:hypothetical protein
MPVIVNEDETDAQYMCDICGVEIQDQTEGTCCPMCGRIFCLDCSADHPITKVRVREDGPDYKKDDYMCDLCYREWRKKHPPQVKLDNFVSGR